MNLSDLHALLEGASDAAVVVDERGIVRYWSRKAEELLGFRRDEVVGTSCTDLLSCVDESGLPLCGHECRAIDAACRKGTVGHYDASVATASGGRRWVNIGVMAARPATKRTLVVLLLRDIEQRKQMELILRDILVSIGRLTGDQADAILRRWRHPTPATPLTPREKEILRELSLGRNVHQISRQYHISTKTVRNHIQHILAKLKCHSRLEAVLQARREGLIP